MLKIDHLRKYYGEICAVDDVSFDVAGGELFGIIGPDGAGKTTLFRIIATLLLADEGTVTFGDRDVVRDFAYVRRNIGYMPGRFSLYQDLSVRENLNFFATIFNTSFEENKYLIKDIYKLLEPFENRKAGALSGGMKQKLALSCALIHKPLLLLLDEPTTGVDAVSRKEFWQMLQNLKNEGITIVVSTPYMDESRLCDKIALMQYGKILDLNSPAGIIQKFNKTVFQVKGQNLYRALKDIRHIKGVAACYPFGESLHLYADDTFDPSNNSGMAGMREKHSLQFAKIQPDIEDCFMHLMAEKTS